MLKVTYWVRDFFGFPRSQVNGFLILIVIVTGFLFSEPVWHWWISNRPHDQTMDRTILDSLIAIWPPTENEESGLENSATISQRFKFDPNKTTIEEFKALGFAIHTAERIMRYREKGGKFRTKSDLLKIYGIDSAFYKTIQPFIILPATVQSALKTSKKYPERKTAPPRTVRLRFDLNKADTSQLKAIYGVGENLSLRIIKYREALGGFVALDQLKEVYGLDSLVIRRFAERSFIENDFTPLTIDINEASETRLSAHPYLRKFAVAIVSYRFQHGHFNSVEDIHKVGTIDQTAFQKIAPYLKVNGDSE